jgi:hypothetical protein
MQGWIQHDALSMSVGFLSVLVCYDGLYPAWQLEYLLTIEV